MDSFEAFYKDVGDPPTESHSLGRIDNDKGYYPENVRWETVKQQAVNRRKTKLISFNGKTMSMTDWAKHLRMHKSTLHRRLNYYNWSVEKALTTPVNHQP